MKHLRLSLIIIFILLLSSCRSYTIKDGRSSIRIPEEGKKIETRFSVLDAERKAEEERIAAIIRAEEEEKARAAEEEAARIRAAELAKAEEERKAAEARAEEERRLAEEKILNAINYYPEDLSEIKFPHVYRPAKEGAVKTDHHTLLTLMMLPLGENELSDENIASIIASISDITPDFIGVTGSLENQVAFAKAYGKDAVTFRSGTLIHRAGIIDKTDSSAVFAISSRKTLSVSILDQKPELPAREEDVAEALSYLPGAEDALAEEALSACSANEERRIFFLSSKMPSSVDWNAFTDYFYRDDMSFLTSEMLLAEGWIDAFDQVRYSVETESGITRRNGEIYERMDFIYVKSIMCSEAVSFPVAGLTDTAGIFATVAEVIVP